MKYLASLSYKDLRINFKWALWRPFSTAYPPRPFPVLTQETLEEVSITGIFQYRIIIDYSFIISLLTPFSELKDFLQYDKWDFQTYQLLRVPWGGVQRNFREKSITLGMIETYLNRLIFFNADFEHHTSFNTNLIVLGSNESGNTKNSQKNTKKATFWGWYLVCWLNPRAF